MGTGVAGRFEACPSRASNPLPSVGFFWLMTGDHNESRVTVMHVARKDVSDRRGRRGTAGAPDSHCSVAIGCVALASSGPVSNQRGSSGPMRSVSRRLWGTLAFERSVCTA